MIDKLGPYALNEIYTGDARVLSESIPDESVDLIFTDPPYPKEFLYLYAWLAEIAARILKPGGSMMTLVGHAYLPYVVQVMGKHLNYHWINCQYQPTVINTATFWPRKIYIRWKPLLWYVKGQYKNSFFIQDGVSPAKRDKNYHKWGQPEDSATYWLYEMAGKLDNPIVFDPFCGGGTNPAVCQQLNISWLAFEIDPATADLARQRVGQTQPPLPIVMPEQLTFETINES